LLQNAVHSIAALLQVKNNAALQKTTKVKTLTYDDHLNLPFSLATAYGNQLAEVDDSYDIHVPVSLLLADAIEPHNKEQITFGNGAAHMSRDKWYNLDSKTKAIWNKVGDRARSIFLRYDNTVGTNKSSTRHH
jgi:hypothetical protein